MLVLYVHKIQYRFLQKSDNCVRYSGRFKNNKNAREKRAGAN